MKHIPITPVMGVYIAFAIILIILYLINKRSADNEKQTEKNKKDD